jgi:hypothetical protein
VGRSQNARFLELLDSIRSSLRTSVGSWQRVATTERRGLSGFVSVQPLGPRAGTALPLPEPGTLTASVADEAEVLLAGPRVGDRRRRSDLEAAPRSVAGVQLADDLTGRDRHRSRPGLRPVREHTQALPGGPLATTDRGIPQQRARAKRAR